MGNIEHCMKYFTRQARTHANENETAILANKKRADGEPESDCSDLETSYIESDPSMHSNEEDGLRKNINIE